MATNGAQAAGDKIRREKRQAATFVVRLIWRDTSGRERFAKASSYDISGSGMRLETPEPVAVRTYITVRCNKLGLHAAGSVRHCRRQGLGWLIGLEFTGGFKWKGPPASVTSSKS